MGSTAYYKFPKSHKLAFSEGSWQTNLDGGEMKYIYAVLLLIIAAAVSVLAYSEVHHLLIAKPSSTGVETDYEEIVVVLLTTVTVLFTVAALILGVLAYLGPRTIRREAHKIAETAVLNSIDEAMKPKGRTAKLLAARFPPNDGPVKDWMEQRIERQVISLLPLIIDRVGVKSTIGPVDPDASDDEGQVD